MGTRIYLASKSPRRLELLARLGYEPVLLPKGPAGGRAFPGDEERLPGESARSYVTRTAREKALHAVKRIREEGLPLLPVIAADTTVVLGEAILGKPASMEEERKFLRLLSGATHVVRTAVVAGTSEENLETVVSESRVTFASLSEEEMEAYARTSEPYDKAGGYAVQGLAAAFITRIDGSYSGIMGLSLRESAGLLARFGAPVPALSD